VSSRHFVIGVVAVSTIGLARCTCLQSVTSLDAGLGDSGALSDAAPADAAPNLDSGSTDSGMDAATCGFSFGPCCPGNTCDVGLSCMQPVSTANPVCIGCYDCDGGCGASGQPCCTGTAAWVICDVGFRCSTCGANQQVCVSPSDGGGGFGSPCGCPSDCNAGLLCCGTCSGVSACELPSDAGECHAPLCADGGSGVGSPCNVKADCADNLNCCYPCGTPDCQNQCMFTDGGACPLFP